MEDEFFFFGFRGVYNIDFDNLEDMNLFQFNIKLGFFLSIIDNVINFFQSRNKLRFFLFFNDCNENQIKIDSEVFVNENLEMDNGESSKENEFLNLKGTKNFYFLDEGLEVNFEFMEMFDFSF